MNPTTEQSTILTAATTTSDNLMLNALAGTGKSATLKLIDRHIKTRPSLYLVFNKRNQLEAVEAQKAGEFRDTTTIKTFNGLGHGIWAKYITGSIHLDPRKPQSIFRAHVDGLKPSERGAAWKHYMVIMDGFAKARNLGYIPDGHARSDHSLISRETLHRHMDEEPTDDAADLLDDLLLESIRLAYAGHIDFSDQIYMPALFGGTFPKFPLVLVDEYQDQAPINHALLRKLIHNRVIGVGDPWQNIYGFRGAQAAGMESAVAQYSMTELPLSVSFRCPQAIVEAARWRVPHFQWHNPGGSVHALDVFEGSSFHDGDTIICRNNAPLIKLAFHLLSAGKSVSVLGSDIGPRVVKLLQKLGDPDLSRARTFEAIEQWREERLIAGSKSAGDLADCMRVFASHGDSLGAAISYAEHLFKQSGTIRLLTGHKSKGLEFDRVYFLDPWLLDDSEQDLNLRYVIQTRSRNSLMILDSSDIKW